MRFQIFFCAFILCFVGLSRHVQASSVNQAEDVSTDMSLEWFIEETKFAQDSVTYALFFRDLSLDRWIGFYLLDEGATLEAWHQMSDYEKFYVLYLQAFPYDYLLDPIHGVSQNTFISTIGFEKSQLMALEGGSDFYHALEKVWLWHWSNWETKQRFINLFEDVGYPPFYHDNMKAWKTMSESNPGGSKWIGMIFVVVLLVGGSITLTWLRYKKKAF